MLNTNSTFGKSIASHMCRLCALHRKAAGWLDFTAESAAVASGPSKRLIEDMEYGVYFPAGLLRTVRVVLAEMADIETVMAGFERYII